MVQLEGQGGGSDWGLRLAGDSDIPTCREIASTFEHDRFHADPLFPNAEADRVKRDWVERNIREDKVFVHGDPPLGFVSLKDGRLELIAVDPEFRGMGYGRKLVEHILHVCPSVKVGTQKNNPALRLYQELGFSVVEEYEVWHGRVKRPR